MNARPLARVRYLLLRHHQYVFDPACAEEEASDVAAIIQIGGLACTQ